jgi:molybdopterin-guanine dinucleotide biosynthesis protein A
MGRDKATLPFGPEVMLQRVVRLLSGVAGLETMCVVASPLQSLPELPAGVMVARDEQEYRGPLQGIATGIAALDGRCDAFYATGCDVPLLAPAFVERMFEMLGDYDVAVPFDGEHHHSLAAVYRLRVLPAVERLLSAGRMRAGLLFDEVQTREVPVDELRVVDPQLWTLENLNHREDYLAALAAVDMRAEDDVS